MSILISLVKGQKFAKQAVKESLKRWEEYCKKVIS